MSAIPQLKSPVAGPNFTPIPALEYNYVAGILVPVGASSAATPQNIPAGTYRMTAEVDTYLTAAATPTAAAANATTDFVLAGTSWHETFDGTTKIATLAKSTTGVLRMIPAKMD